MSKKLYLSYSQINKWDMCPKSYEYTYILKTPTPKSGMLIAGNAYHKALEFLLTKKKNGEHFEVKDALDLTREIWKAAMEPGVVSIDGDGNKIEPQKVNWGEIEPDRMLDIILTLVYKYVSTVIDDVEPLEIEKKYYLDISNDIVFIAKPDIITASYEVIDHKLSTRVKGQSYLDNDMQSLALATVLQRPIKFTLHQAVTSGNTKIIINSINRSDSDIDWYRDKIVKTAALIKTGMFPPCTQSFLCSPKFCPFYADCRVMI